MLLGTRKLTGLFPRSDPNNAPAQAGADAVFESVRSI